MQTYDFIDLFIPVFEIIIMSPSLFLTSRSGIICFPQKKKKMKIKEETHETKVRKKRNKHKPQTTKNVPHSKCSRSREPKRCCRPALLLLGQSLFDLKWWKVGKAV